MAQGTHEPGRIWAAVDYADRFFMRQSPVHHALAAIARTLDQLGVPYAVAGAMALNEYGYERVTRDVDVLVTREGLAQLKAEVLGRGYVEKFPGSKGLRDTENNVAIDFLLAGEYPGDGKPKPVRFPAPEEVGVRRGGILFLPLPKLVEFKLASGLSLLDRAKDIGDVVELIHAASLPKELADELDPSVRPKYVELWEATRVRKPE